MTHTRPTITHHTPIGTLTLSATDQGLLTSTFTNRKHPPRVTAPTDLLTRAARQLDEYLAGTRTQFEIPLDLTHLSPFDQAVRTALTRIEYGDTTTYGQLTRELGLPAEDVRKVGAALARNPVPVIVPCHRVVGATGALTGYAGGLPAKRWLLDLENNQAAFPLDLTG